MKESKSEYDIQLERILAILEVDSEKKEKVDEQSLDKYLGYIKDNVVFPCIVTGIEDFEWGEFYVLGQGDEKEHEELKKTRPSFADRFEIIKFNDEPDDMYGIIVEVLRLSDKKKFDLPLSDLETEKDSSRNRQLLDDYSVWFVNNR